MLREDGSKNTYVVELEEIDQLFKGKPSPSLVTLGRLLSLTLIFAVCVALYNMTSREQCGYKQKEPHTTSYSKLCTWK